MAQLEWDRALDLGARGVLGVDERATFVVDGKVARAPDVWEAGILLLDENGGRRTFLDENGGRRTRAGMDRATALGSARGCRHLGLPGPPRRRNSVVTSYWSGHGPHVVGPHRRCVAQRGAWRVVRGVVRINKINFEVAAGGSEAHLQNEGSPQAKRKSLNMKLQMSRLLKWEAGRVS